MENINLLKIKYLPKELDRGVLYVSEEFGVAGHMCPCGCGNKVITPLGPIDWTFTEEGGKPTLHPSIGNWQLPCKSHYWIREGMIFWSYQFPNWQIKEGFQQEELRRKVYYKKLNRKGKSRSFVLKISDWLSKIKSDLFGKV